MSGSLDPTFLNALANPPAANPQYWGQQMQNMNALQDYQAKQATAQAYQQSVDPNTGQIDQAKFNALLAGGPGAWNAGAAMQQQGQAQGAQAQGSSEQVAGRLAQMKILSGEMTDLLQSGQPITADQIHARLNSLGQEGIITPAAMNGINADLNSQPPGADLTGWLRNHYATNLSASEALKNVTSQPQTIDQGDRKIVVEGNPNLPGGRRVGTSYVQGQAPPALGTTVTIQYSDGTTKQVTPDQVQSELGGNPGSKVVAPAAGVGGSVSSSEAPVNAAGDSATRKASEGGPPAPGTPAAAVAQRTHDFWASQGYTEAQIAGILAGGPGSESDFNPTVSGDKGTSYGLYQHHAERLAAMQKYFGLSGNQMPSEAQQNQYAAYEISPQGPLAAVGAQLKAAQTPAEAAAIWTRSFGVPGDKTEIGRRAAGAGRYAGLYATPGTQGGQQPQQPTTPPAAPAAPPGVQMGGAPPPPPGGSQAPYTGGGIGAALAPGGAANPVVIRGTPIPAGRVVGSNVPAYVGAIQAGRQLAGATPMPANALVAGPGAPTAAAPVPWGTGTVIGSYGAGPTAPAVQPPPAPAVPPQPATPAPVAGRSAPPGYVEKVKADVAGYVADQAAYPDVQTRAQNLAHAYDALNQLRSATGKGAQGINDLRSYAQTLGILPAGAVNEQRLFEVVHKYTERAMIDAAGGAGTDLGRRMQEQANAGTLLSTPANAEIMRNDMGKTLQTMAAYKDQQDKSGVGYLDNRAKVADSTDPRGFVWNLYSPQERAQINAEVAKSPAAADKLHKAIGMSQRLNLQIPGLTAR
jgi:hypothetical protein